MLHHFVDIRIIHSNTSAKRMLEQMAKEPADVLISDLESDDLDILQFAPALKRLQSVPKLIVNSSFHPGPLVKPLLRLGISTYCIKDSMTAAYLHKIINEVYEQSYCLTEVVTYEIIQRTWLAREDSNLPDFSDREGELLLYLCQGYSRREVSSALNISESTVKFHIQNLIEKAEVSSTLDLIIRAVNSDWPTALKMKKKFGHSA